MEYPKMEEYAIENNIPIMQKEGVDFLINIALENNSKTCLEIGSAIGYSAIMMTSNIDDFKVETLELNEDRYNEALKNIDLYNQKNNIYIHNGDALEFNIDDLVIKEYDFLFIDAAKAQYKKFFEKYMPLIKKGGYCIVDNLDFHGMIYDIDNIKNRNTKQLVKKIKRFKDWIFNNEEYNVEYFKIGDGICVIRRR
ncbi:MAG: O-methyltransferase [Thomasclavelia sp.]|nr:O-methyltransferase [Thomasclavelia sp.]